MEQLSEYKIIWYVETLVNESQIKFIPYTTQLYCPRLCLYQCRALTPDYQCVNIVFLPHTKYLSLHQHLLNVSSCEYCRPINSCYIFSVLRQGLYLISHIMRGSWKGRGKLLTNGKKLHIFPHEVRQGRISDLFIYCFTLHSKARVILRRVVYRWRKPVHTAL